VQHEHLTKHDQLIRFCDSVRDAQSIAFDTEFVSEDSYRPQLCLAQVAADGQLAVIDTLAIRDLTPFWELLAAPGHRTIVHAGRSELCFCQRATGKRPHRLFDVQIAAGMIGMEYPAAYRTLIFKLLGNKVQKGETRTDWRRRPLSRRQIEYALRDVLYLEEIRQILTERLEQLGRLDWFETEMVDWQDAVETAELTDRWRRVSGMSSLTPRSLAIVRELWHWRDAEAERKNCPPRRILRDDLIVELARHEKSDVASIQAIRGLNHRGKQRYLEPISQCIVKGLELPEAQCPHPAPRAASRAQFAVLGQLMATALSSICRSKDIAPSLVGTVEDVRDLIAYTLGEDDRPRDQAPALARGWRAEVVGDTIRDLLAGRVTIRVAKPQDEQPLVFEPRPRRAKQR
jgi:ribonuclease D